MAILKIQNTNEFDQQVWQYETEFTNEQYQKAIDNFAEVAQRIYDAIDQCEEIDVDTTDLYQLGDLINMLSNIKVETAPQSDTDAEYVGHCWDCTREDFESEEYANYDLSGKSDEEVRQMIDEVADMMQNDYVSSMYWQCVNDVAEAHGLTKNTNKDE